MLPNEIIRRPFTVFFDLETGGDVYTAHVLLPENSTAWTESDVLDSVLQPGEDRETVGIIAVVPGHLRSLWGAAIPA